MGSSHLVSFLMHLIQKRRMMTKPGLEHDQGPHLICGKAILHALPGQKSGYRFSAKRFFEPAVFTFQQARSDLQKPIPPPARRRESKSLLRGIDQLLRQVTVRKLTQKHLASPFAI